ncbi:unnamed protein product (mitochondrion) [Plasmodiophora brassicae]|uniref:N-acetyltransferase domain-containing protein n=1 Tax=Plasmodiophora brassicae TaxID=37360 RepID=A0A3P3Y5S3_PLABS|nr:unnamed protein product [Plasmodiophora brassicae]
MQCALREIDSSKRRLPAGDAALVAQCDIIERRLFPKHESLTGQLEREAMKRSQTMVVAVVDGSSAVGYMIVSRTGHIVKLAVAAAAQRNGVGRWLLRWARSRYQTLSLHVDPERHAAVALYRSEGFTAHGQICDYYCDGRHALLMRLDRC